MDSQKVTENYQKTDLFEDVLSSLNNQLKISQPELFQKKLDDQVTIHVIGAPRSGTTVLTQLFISNFDIGYINNFIATFWNAPLYGIHLSKKMLGENYESDLKSDFGRTLNVQEPHEFGYFWKEQLSYTEHLQQTYNKDHSIDWNNLKNILYQMCYAFDKPILFKSFLYGFHLKEAVIKMPKTLFVYIERDLYQNAYSILKLRIKMFGDQSVWASIKPCQYDVLKNENIYRQIMGQIMFLNYEYKKQLAQIPNKNKLLLKYTDVCVKTNEVMQLMYDKITNLEQVNFVKAEVQVIENIVDIPIEILKELKSAEDWLKSNFIELNK